MTMRRNLMRATAAAALALTLAPVFAQGVIKIGEVNSYKAQPAFLEPYKNKTYHLTVEGLRFEGTTDGDGAVIVMGQPDLVALDADHRDGDVRPDPDDFLQLPCQHQHGAYSSLLG